MGATTLAPPQPQDAAASPPSSPPGPWIYRPWIDLTVGGGAWSAPLLLAGFYAANAYGQTWTVAFYFLALLFNYPHFMATVYRAYHTHAEFAKYRIFTIHVALILALAGVVAHLWYPLLPWIFTLYICWSPWHYTGQNFGLLMMFARRAGVPPTEAERRALHLSFIASYVLLMVSFHTGTSGDPLVLSVGLVPRFTLPARVALAIFFVGASGWAIASLARRSTVRAIIAPLTLTVTQFLWFLLPVAIELISGREVPQTRYSSGLLAVLHSTQYLWITSYYQKREAHAAGESNWRVSRYLVTLVAGGIALFIPGPWIVSRVFHADFAASFLTFTALVNLHHFILDGALWKLRDSRIAALLLDTRQRAGDAVTGTRGGFAAATGWLAGQTRGARMLRIGTAMLLFGWAGLDQLRFYWSSKTSNLASLERAAELNPNDSAVQMRLARAEQLVGQREASVQAMQRAAVMSPDSLEVQETFARSLIEVGRDADAYAQYQKMLTRWPRNTNALVNYGLLAQRLGHEEDAIDSWQRAVDVDPTQANAQLYLAQGLDQRGEIQAAARHYRAYLESAAADPAEHPGETGTVLAALIKVADADAAVNQAAEASKGYSAAIGYAEQAGDKALESLSLAHFADLQDKQGDPAGAAGSYQRALALDAGLSDPRSAAVDWFNYGQFLHRHRQPERLVFSCFLKAEGLLGTNPNPSGELNAAVRDARAESEVRLGQAAATVRRNFQETANEAAALPTTAFASVVAREK
jgi:tetratricopeptide (TPR) repeat protein